MRRLNYLRMKWQIFTYNFAWPKYVFLLNGWLAKCAMAVPFVGYLIIFNDTVSSHLSFDRLANESASAFGLTSLARLKFLYLGMVSLGVANAFYYLRRPYVLRIGIDQVEYVDRALKNFTLENYISIHDEIRHSGYDPYTRHGKYYDSEYESFMNYAAPSSDGGLAAMSQQFHWVDAKAKYETLLRSMLIENYFRNSIKNRVSLSISLVLAVLGYVLMAIPSADLFLKVMRVIVRPII